MSIVIIAFEGAPKVSEEAQKKEAVLDAKLETKVKGVILSQIITLLLSSAHFVTKLLECSIGSFLPGFLSFT